MNIKHAKILHKKIPLPVLQVLTISQILILSSCLNAENIKSSNNSKGTMYMNENIFNQDIEFGTISLSEDGKLLAAAFRYKNFPFKISITDIESDSTKTYIMKLPPNMSWTSPFWSFDQKEMLVISSCNISECYQDYEGYNVWRVGIFSGRLEPVTNTDKSKQRHFPAFSMDNKSIYYTESEFPLPGHKYNVSHNFIKKVDAGKAETVFPKYSEVHISGIRMRGYMSDEAIVTGIYINDPNGNINSSKTRLHVGKEFAIRISENYYVVQDDIGHYSVFNSGISGNILYVEGSGNLVANCIFRKTDGKIEKLAQLDRQIIEDIASTSRLDVIVAITTDISTRRQRVWRIRNGEIKEINLSELALTEAKREIYAEGERK